MRRSMSMSQWVRGALTFLASGSGPSISLATVPSRRQSHVLGISALVDDRAHGARTRRVVVVGHDRVHRLLGRQTCGGFRLVAEQLRERAAAGQ